MYVGMQATMLSIPDLIKKKRDGNALSDEDIQFFLQAVVEENIQEAQTGQHTHAWTHSHTLSHTHTMKCSTSARWSMGMSGVSG